MPKGSQWDSNQVNRGANQQIRYRSRPEIPLQGWQYDKARYPEPRVLESLSSKI